MFSSSRAPARARASFRGLGQPSTVDHRPSRSRRLNLAAISLLLLVLASSAWAQGNGQSLCSGGTRDGANCLVDGDCQGGVCVVTQGICDGGSDDGLDCDCAGSTCSTTPACLDIPSAGTCAGGPFQGSCCDTEFGCRGGSGCTGTQKICESGEFKGLACLKDADCLVGSCLSPGKACVSDHYPCFDDSDCVNTNDTCEGPGFVRPTATPTVTPGGSSPTPTPTVPAGACVGDCGGNNEVTVDELLRLVNIALGNLPVSNCPAGNPNGDAEITIDEILVAVNNTLAGCPVVAATESNPSAASASLPRRYERRRR